MEDAGSSPAWSNNMQFGCYRYASLVALDLFEFGIDHVFGVGFIVTA